jgi:hypothetical protein
MQKAAVGFRVHSGWTALVVVSVEKDLPVVLSRQRLNLVKIFSYKFRQPFHTAEKMPFANASKFISSVRTDAEEIAYNALRVVKAELKKQGHELDLASLLLASGKPLPDLEKILQSHALIHTADGELFRQVLRLACKRCGVELACARERDLLELCAQAFSLPPAELQRRVTELGRPVGSPWSQDEKFATLAAWLAITPNGRDLLAEQ